jgi:hypothetical protein
MNTTAPTPRYPSAPAVGRTGVYIDGIEVTWSKGCFHWRSFSENSVAAIRSQIQAAKDKAEIAKERAKARGKGMPVHVQVGGEFVLGTFRGMSAKDNGQALVTLDGSKNSVYISQVYRLLTEDELAERDRLAEAYQAATKARKDYYEVLTPAAPSMSVDVEVDDASMTARIIVYTRDRYRDPKVVQFTQPATFDAATEKWVSGTFSAHALHPLAQVVMRNANPDIGKTFVSADGEARVVAVGDHYYGRGLVDGWDVGHYQTLLAIEADAEEAIRSWGAAHRLSVGEED